MFSPARIREQKVQTLIHVLFMVSYNVNTMIFVDGNHIRIDKELSELDNFTLDFIEVLREHTRYVVVSGYVSILLGRARSSEDVDVIIPKIGFKEFSDLVNDLKKSSFWCIQTEENRDIFKYFNDGVAVRFARKGDVIPNIELKPVKNRIDVEALENYIEVVLEKGSIHISNLELQVAFKEQVLKSPKDIEDARHLRNIAGEKLSTLKLKEYEEILNGIY
jgi:hypothetical protein